MNLPSARRMLDARAMPRGSPAWTRAELAGRLVEVAGWRDGATCSAALALVVDAQRQGEPAVWVGTRDRAFFPPDAEQAGVDLEALPVVRVAAAREIPAAADVLARCGAFGLIVLDLCGFAPSMAVLSRLAGLARAHDTAIVMLTEKTAERASLGSIVSFRADSSFARRDDGSFAHELKVTRDRLRAMAWRHVEFRRGPPGLS